MPWGIFDGEKNQKCVHKLTPEGDKGELVECHDKLADAEAHQAALYANAGEEAKGLLVKAVTDGDEWALDVLGVPYGGPHAGKDAQGEYFTADTELWLDQIPQRPIVYYHGLAEGGEAQIIGREVTHTRKADGVWFRVILDKTSALARKVWDAAKAGMARASSGAIAHLVRTARDGKILVWPIGELSLLDAREHQPANQYAVALPAAKALYARAGLSFNLDNHDGQQADGTGEQQPDPASAQNGGTDYRPMQRRVRYLLGEYYDG